MRNDANRTPCFVEGAGMLVRGETVGRHEHQQQAKPRYRLEDWPHGTFSRKNQGKSNLHRNKKRMQRGGGPSVPAAARSEFANA
jgi:hypothetical protein